MKMVKGASNFIQRKYLWLHNYKNLNFIYNFFKYIILHTLFFKSASSVRPPIVLNIGSLYDGFKRWISNPKISLAIVLIASGAAITVYFGNLETVPFTNRTHLVILSTGFEKKLGEICFKHFKKQHKEKILPPLHPDSIRVEKILDDIVEGLKKRSRKEQLRSDAEDTEEETVDDGRVWKMGVEAQTAHLEGLRWEIIVVNDSTVNARCVPGGKIAIFTGLLDHARTDAEIATIIGHEVAHIVARHSVEQISKSMWLTILQLVLYQFSTPDIVYPMSKLFLGRPLYRRKEMEADYIGLLLTASAGYDPRLVPQVYDKLAEIASSSPLQDYLATHPSGRTRAKLLSEAKVMDEALSIYWEAQNRRGLHGFSNSSFLFQNEHLFIG